MRHNVEVLLVIEGDADEADQLGEQLCRELEGRAKMDTLNSMLPLAIVQRASVEAVAKRKGDN